MLNLRQFVPREVCLSCRGCCRFPIRDTVWAPLFLFEEILELTQENIVPSCLFVHADTRAKKAARIDLIEDTSGFICPCLETKTNRCKIYEARPLECRLYPFLLALKDREAYLALDIKCPYGQQARLDKSFKEYVRHLEEFLQSKEFLNLVKNNPEIVQNYGQDAEFLIALPELSHCIHETSSSRGQR